jgi:hypothetical protein
LENGRVMRWALFLQNYKFKIEAIKGSENIIADFLSREGNTANRIILEEKNEEKDERFPRKGGYCQE